MFIHLNIPSLLGAASSYSYGSNMCSDLSIADHAEWLVSLGIAFRPRSIQFYICDANASIIYSSWKSEFMDPFPKGDRCRAKHTNVGWHSTNRWLWANIEALVIVYIGSWDYLPIQEWFQVEVQVILVERMVSKYEHGRPAQKEAHNFKERYNKQTEARSSKNNLGIPLQPPIRHPEQCHL